MQNWCSVLQSAKEESHHLRPWTFKGVREMVSSEPHSWTQNWEKG
jgi:hypothetical protein